MFRGSSNNSQLSGSANRPQLKPTGLFRVRNSVDVNATADKRLINNYGNYQSRGPSEDLYQTL